MRVIKTCGSFLIQPHNAYVAGMNSLFTYLKNVRAELAHVVWPSRTQALIYTVIIVLISGILALAIAGLDYGFTGVVNRLVSS